MHGWLKSRLVSAGPLPHTMPPTTPQHTGLKFRQALQLGLNAHKQQTEAQREVNGRKAADCATDPGIWNNPTGTTHHSASVLFDVLFRMKDLLTNRARRSQLNSFTSDRNKWQEQPRDWKHDPCASFRCMYVRLC